MRDLVHALRRLRATPVFTLFAIASLALGLGVTTAVASMVRAVFTLPPGVADRADLVNVYAAPMRGSGAVFVRASFSWADYRDLKARQTTFQELTAWTFFRQAFAANGRTETAFGEMVGGDYFRTLGVAAAVGRTLQPDDDRPGAPLVAVISHRAWQRIFEGAPDIVGRFVKMNGHSFEIVGVVAPAFHGVFNNGLVASSIWVPISATALLPSEGSGRTLDPQARERRWLMLKGRLKPGRTIAEAQAELASIGRQLDAAYPRPRSAQQRAPDDVNRLWTAHAATDVVINETVDAFVRPLAAALLTAVALVLLVACSNLANLMLARGGARRQEIAVRLALGASRARLVRESLIESAVLAVAGGVAGLGVARVVLVLIGTDLRVGAGAALHLEADIDMLVTIGACLATLLALCVAGLVPAWQTTRPDVRAELASGGSGGALLRWRGRRVLIGVQVMVSLFLLALAAASVDVVRRDAANETGLDLERIAVAHIDFRLQKYEQARARQIADAVVDQMRVRDDVAAVAISSGLPIGITTPSAFAFAVDRRRGAIVETMVSTPGIFRTLGVAIVRGRGLDARDLAAAQRVVVLSAKAATDLFGSSDAVGRRVIYKRQPLAGAPPPADDALTVVGIAADTDVGSPGYRKHGTAYLPIDQHDERRLTLSVRTDGNPSNLTGALRRAIAAVDPELAVADLGTGVEVAAPGNLFLQITAGVASLLGGFALVLALAGLYGALSHAIARRTREIGLRMALGATPRDVTRMILREGMTPVVLGIAAGLTLGFLARLTVPAVVVVRLLPAFNPLPLVVAPLSMLAAAAIACYLPARRAARVDPNVALRDL
jgi:predicted permease